MSSIRCSEGSAWINRKKNSTDTGLYHVGAREYDPRTARWLQRDPIGVAGGHPNVYLYCLNQPVTRTDPSGQDCIVVFIHGTMSNDKTFSKEFMDHASKSLGAVAQYNYAWKSSSKPMASTANRYSIQGDEADTFKDFIENIPNPSGLPIVVIAHSMAATLPLMLLRMALPSMLLFVWVHRLTLKSLHREWSIQLFLMSMTRRIRLSSMRESLDFKGNATKGHAGTLLRSMRQLVFGTLYLLV